MKLREPCRCAKWNEGLRPNRQTMKARGGGIVTGAARRVEIGRVK
jgi:hypothetical protein